MDISKNLFSSFEITVNFEDKILSQPMFTAIVRPIFDNLEMET